VINEWMGLGACDCPEAHALRHLITELDSPSGMLDRLASIFAIWKLRTMSHDLSLGDWSREVLPWAKRQEYDTPPRSVEEVREQVRASWAEFDQKRGPLWTKTTT
jgi:hypothetical protein